ncbi:MAG TPA: PPE domain-containing protein [Pseudonocardiaceae bacterium]|nr:PPE domain-containing protein [Pseudonocardiaceae bacterium]
MTLGHTHWEHYSHQQMWDMIMSADPKAVMGRATDMSDLAKAMGEDAEQVRSTLQTLLSSWSGPAADQTAAAIKPVLDWAAEAATTATEIAARMGHYAEAINTARTHMPAPVDYRQLNAVADGQTVTVSDLDVNAPELSAMAHGHTATAEQAAASKSKAVEVMRRYEHTSATAYHGMPTFSRPPKLPGLVSQPPAPTMPPPPGPVPTQPPGHDKTEPSPTAPASTLPSSVGATTPSSFVGPLSPGGLGAAVGGGPGLVGTGGAIGGGGIGAAGAVGASNPLVSGAAVGEGAMSTAGRMAAAEGELAAEQGGWGGFAPMGGGGARSGQDGEHRDKYAGKPDLFGELPPAFPPVLGL